MLTIKQLSSVQFLSNINPHMTYIYPHSEQVLNTNSVKHSYDSGKKEITVKS